MGVVAVKGIISRHDLEKKGIIVKGISVILYSRVFLCCSKQMEIGCLKFQ
jgi:hypothetical protein